MLNTIKLFADSVADLPQDWIERYGIGIVPLYIIFGDEASKDGVDITTADLYRRVESEGVLPKTAAPSPDDFIQAFAPEVQAGHSVLFISMSSKVSSTYQNARIAMNEFPEGAVTVVDSAHLSAGSALLVIQAARMLERGSTIEETAAFVESRRSDVEMNVLIDRLDYLHKGGRVSSIQNLVGSMLQIRPVLGVKNGLIISTKKYRGKMQKALDGILQELMDRIDSVELELIVIAHTVAEQSAHMMRQYLQERTAIREVVIIEGGCTICSHTGPNTVAISYMMK